MQSERKNFLSRSRSGHLIEPPLSPSSTPKHSQPSSLPTYEPEPNLNQSKSESFSKITLFSKHKVNVETRRFTAATPTALKITPPTSPSSQSVPNSPSSQSSPSPTSNSSSLSPTSSSHNHTSPANSKKSKKLETARTFSLNLSRTPPSLRLRKGSSPKNKSSAELVNTSLAKSATARSAEYPSRLSSSSSPTAPSGLDPISSLFLPVSTSISNSDHSTPILHNNITRSSDSSRYQSLTHRSEISIQLPLATTRPNRSGSGTAHTFEQKTGQLVSRAFSDKHFGRSSSLKIKPKEEQRALPTLNHRRKHQVEEVEFPLLEDSQKQGLLNVFDKSLNDWLKVWVVLSDGHLSQYTSEKASEELSKISLAKAKMTEKTVNGKQCFEIFSPPDTNFLFCVYQNENEISLKTREPGVIDPSTAEFEHYSWMISLNGSMAIYSDSKETAGSTSPSGVGSRIEEVSVKKPKSKQSSKSHKIGTKVEDEPSPAPQKQTFSKKGSLKLFKAKLFWTKQWVELKEDGTLHISPSEGGRARLVINIMFCSAKMSPPNLYSKYCFEIINTDKTYILMAESGTELMEWVTLIQNSQAGLMKNFLSYDLAHSDDSKKEENDEFEIGRKKLQELLARPGNNCCAECLAKDPIWASINLGIFLCINCSGPHRQLGAHISKVRSVTMDKWNNETLKVMEEKGNTIANSYWEHNIGDGYSKPLPNDNMEKRYTFIKAKYADRLFVDPSVPYTSTS